VRLDEAILLCKKNASLYHEYRKDVAEILNKIAIKFREKNSLSVAEKLLSASVEIYPE